ncbi:TetR/AcrR family transcriptional regulator [Streptomyces acidiscabies]|uniref:TetR/AcrR family transcriptional regulator n=1 Tax=Streptomyces acidiscabies TaxID=42234 RepID=UPI00076EB37D|nr:TetR/AcrR family transcriptional regulator [Streptomyces acidiscabies]GAQ58405.1 transcriptional regulator BetI [Streptomyces acidiscabies]
MAHVPAAVRRTQIIEAAAAVIARDGVAGATTRRIAAEAELSLATLHYVFKTKDEILAGVLESLIEHADQDNSTLAAHLVTPAGAGAPVPSEVVHHLVRTAWGLVCGDLVSQRVEYELTLYALRTPEAAHLGRTLREYNLTAIERIVRQGLEYTGQVSRIPARELAHLIYCAVDGVLLDHLVDPDGDRADRSLAHLAGAVLSLVGTPPGAVSV